MADPADDEDEYVDRLYSYRHPRFHMRGRSSPVTPPPVVPVTPPPVVVSTRPRPRPPTPATPPTVRHGGIRIPKWLFVVALLYVFGSAVAMGGDDTEPSTTVQPGSTRTVTVTVTERSVALPESCKRVLEILPRVMDDMNQLNGKSQAQIDIISAVHRAIQRKEWEDLSLLEARQARLAQQDEEAYQHFKQSYQPLKDALAQCEKDSK